MQTTKTASLILCILFSAIMLACVMAPVSRLKTWESNAEFDKALQAVRRAVVETNFAVTTMDFDNGFITAEKRFTQGVFIRKEHVWRMNITVSKTDSSVLIEAGAVADNSNYLSNNVLKEFANNLQKYLPDTRISSAY